jgi:SAM-dependent methyltransferase
MGKTFSKIINFLKNPERYSNRFYIKYHLLRYYQKLLVKLRVKKEADYHKKDTFDWSLYTLHYQGELKESSKEFTQTLHTGDYRFEGNRLIKANEKIKPIHMNHHLMYETILQLGPSSVFELGCGNGMHLHNLQVLMPQVKLTAIDLLKSQIDFLHKTYPDLNAEIKQMDATIPFPDEMPKADLVFSQAVLMHIHTDKLHQTALANMFKVAEKFVILYESTRTHNYIEDIKKLHKNGKTSWDHIFIHIRINEFTNEPTSFICSKTRLDYNLLAEIS